MTERKRYRLNVLGDFYVEDGCCTMCGVPEVEAPALFDSNDEQCFVKQQPRTSHEVDRMLLAMINSELACVRYAGTAPSILKRLAERGESELSDQPCPTSVRRVLRDHAGLRGLPHGTTAQTLMADFIGYLRSKPMPERFELEVETSDEDRCVLRVSWFQKNFRSIVFERSSAPEFDWLIVGLELTVADWLADEKMGEVLFFEGADWRGARTGGTNVPW